VVAKIPNLVAAPTMLLLLRVKTRKVAAVATRPTVAALTELLWLRDPITKAVNALPTSLVAVPMELPLRKDRKDKVGLRTDLQELGTYS